MTSVDEDPWSQGWADAAEDPGTRAHDRGAPSDETAEPTWTVPEVAEKIRAMLEQTFPRPFWVAGETSDLERTFRKSGYRGHWYFGLVDDQASDERRRASLSVKMWSRTVQRLFGPRGRVRGAFEPADGLVLRVLVRPDFYAPRGELSFIVEDVDPSYTLGNLDRARRELLERLEHEGAAAWNKQVALPDVPLRVGLVTADGSAAFRDVVEGLHGSGFGFDVLLCEARMQGAETGPRVCAALATLARRDVDVILLARGGGSRVDLSWFDREDIARAIAGCPVPVLTGIGHEIDTSVADVVAHRSFKTPTAAAEFLVLRARAAFDGLDVARTTVIDTMTRRLDHERHALAQTARATEREVLARLRENEVELRDAPARVTRASRAALDRVAAAVATAGARLQRGRHNERLAGLDAALIAAGARLDTGTRTALERLEHALDRAAARCELLDPRRVLARGYAYLRDDEGRLLVDATRARVGSTVTAVLRDGEIETTVERIRTTPPTETGEPGP